MSKTSNEAPGNMFESELHLQFERLGLMRRAALGLLPHVQDPEMNSPMKLSTLKSSRNYRLEGNTATLCGGYRLCRASRRLPTDKKYYWEFEFSSQSPDDGHIRVGIATKQADMEAPVGVDKFGYGIRDLGGSYHDAHRNRKMITPKFGKGDVVGLGFIPGEKSISLKLFINGKDEGIVFDDIQLSSDWIPALSIFHKAVVIATFSRPFKYDPGGDWAAADQIPPEEDKNHINPVALLKYMEGTLICRLDEKDDYFEAMDQALVPPHLMVI